MWGVSQAVEPAFGAFGQFQAAPMRSVNVKLYLPHNYGHPLLCECPQTSLTFDGRGFSAGLSLVPSGPGGYFQNMPPELAQPQLKHRLEEVSYALADPAAGCPVRGGQLA